MIATPWGRWEMKHESLKQTNAEARRLAFVLGPRPYDKPERHRRGVELPTKVMEAIRTAEEDLEVGGRLAKFAVQSVTWVVQLCGGRFPGEPDLHHNAKINEVVDLVTGELAKSQCVVWARLTAEIDAVAFALKQAGVKIAKMTGKTGVDRPQRQLVKGKVDVIVGQAMVGGAGVDLSAARSCVFMSNHASLDIREQAEMRLAHPKKKTRPIVWDVVAEGTYDEDLAAALTMKRIVQRTLWGAVQEARAKRLVGRRTSECGR
jgi:hypothetical protein